ncbi:MAG: hypothetical protein ABEJ93_04800 [Candidatus Nanohalobium sp.]
MKNKTAALLTAALLMTGLCTATTFGTFTYQKTKKTGGGPVQYKIGLLNLGEQPLKIEVDPETDSQLNLSYNRTMELPESEVTENPEKGRWYPVSRKKYAEVHVYSFKAIPGKLENRSFQLTLQAYPENSENQTGSSQTIIQERTLRFNIVNTSYNQGLIQFQEETGEETENTSNAVEKNPARFNQSSNSSKIEEPGSEREKSRGLNLFLVFGALLALAYLVKVILS